MRNAEQKERERERERESAIYGMGHDLVSHWESKGNEGTNERMLHCLNLGSIFADQGLLQYSVDRVDGVYLCRTGNGERN